MLRLDPQWQTDSKFGTFSLFRLNLNGSSHHSYDVLGDRHAKPRTLGPADCRSPLPLKRRKELLYKFLTHADSVILHPDLVQLTAADRPRILLQTDRNGSACRRKLDGIGQQIQQHLVQPRLITIDVLVRNIHGIHIKLQLLRMDLPADDRLQIMKHLRQTDLCFFQMDLSALNTAHIQYIIDQREQMIAGCEDLAQVIPYSFLIINIAYSQCRKTNNRIHWGPDIVRHVGKKRTLCMVGSLRSTGCLGKCLIHFPVRGTIRHDKNIFLLSVYLTAHYNIMKPAPFPCFLMHIFKIPFLLFFDLDSLQIILLRIFRTCGLQSSQNINVLLDLFCCNAQQLFRIRTDVICLICFCIQHQKNVIHIH